MPQCRIFAGTVDGVVMGSAQTLLYFASLLLAASASVTIGWQHSKTDAPSGSPPQPVSKASDPSSPSRNGAPPLVFSTAEPPAPLPAVANPRPATWLPPAIDSFVPLVQEGVECPLPQVVSASGQRMKELVENLQRFDATENVEHFRIDDAGARGRRETRLFDYNVNITLSKSGVFNLDEYRNGRADPAQFPALIATQGLSAMALLLHPIMISDFNFTCEGLGQWNGRPAWQVRFEQRADRPNRLRAYVIARRPYAVPLKGRVWIDAATYQVQRLESELIKPVPEIRLTQERMAINYGPVQFQANKELWLPLNADVYWERRSQRFYRRHSFSNFKLFGVDSTQQIGLPEESYCFKNTSDRNIAGILTVSPATGVPAKPVSIQFTILPGRKVCKLIGAGKDLNMLPENVGPATFAHNGHALSIVAEVNLASTLEVIPESEVSPLAH